MITVTATTDGNASLSFQRNLYLLKPKKIYFLISQEEYEYFTIDIELLEQEIDSAPLNKRAWAMQETRLLPRIIHFEKGQLFWTCNENELCESFPKWLPEFSKNSPVKYASIAFRVHYMLATQLVFAMGKNNIVESMMYRVESGQRVYYKRHSLRGYVLNMFTTYGCSLSRLQYCIDSFEAY